MQLFSKIMLQSTSKWNYIEQKMFMDKSTFQNHYLVSWLLKKKFLIQRNRWYSLFHAWESVCLFHMCVNFFITWLFAYKYLITATFFGWKSLWKTAHAISMQYYFLAIQNYAIFTLCGDFGLNDTGYLDDINTESNMYKKSKYTLVRFAFGIKEYYTCIHTLISKQQQKKKKRNCPIQSTQSIHSNPTGMVFSRNVS